MNVVVTGGATIAPIDDVRQLTNVSTGRFGAAITEACFEGPMSGTFTPGRPSCRFCGSRGLIWTRPRPISSSTAW